MGHPKSLDGGTRLFISYLLLRLLQHQILLIPLIFYDWCCNIVYDIFYLYYCPQHK